MNPKSRARRGLWLGVLAMAMFGLTLPMTRLATGSAEAPELSPWFVTFGRAVVAAALSSLVLMALRAPRPDAAQWRSLVVAAAGNAVLYPLGLALALPSVGASHTAVITALLPLTTAVAAALALRQRQSVAFWACALAGCAVVVGHSLLRAAQRGEAWRPAWADGLVALGVVAASIGYVHGARVTRALGAEQAICWVTLLTLPVALPVAWLARPDDAVSAQAWVGFGYVALFSMWAAFFAWYRALDWGGAVRVSQVQVLQPFFAIGFSVPLLGERIDGWTLAAAAAVIGTVTLSQRLQAAAAPATPARPAR